MVSKTVVPKEAIVGIVKGFYEPHKHHLVSIHGVDIGGSIEVQWVFCEYEDENIKAFASEFAYDDTIPSFRDILPSSWIHEAELKDMFGVDVEGAKFGLFLEEDGVKAPLRRNGV